MTLNEVVEILDDRMDNAVELADKYRWINQLETEIYNDVILTHAGSELIPAPNITPDSPGDTVLLVPPPFDEVYIHYLMGKIDFLLREYGRYNNDMSAYTTEIEAYKAWYNRTHKALLPSPRYY